MYIYIYIYAFVSIFVFRIYFLHGPPPQELAQALVLVASSVAKISVHERIPKAWSDEKAQAVAKTGVSHSIIYNI